MPLDADKCSAIRCVIPQVPEFVLHPRQPLLQLSNLVSDLREHCVVRFFCMSNVLKSHFDLVREYRSGLYVNKYPYLTPVDLDSGSECGVHQHYGPVSW